LDLWKKCVNYLEGELPSQQFNTWIRPLHAIQEDNRIRLLAPNKFVLDWVDSHYIAKINTYIAEIEGNYSSSVLLEIGSHPREPKSPNLTNLRHSNKVDSKKPSAISAANNNVLESNINSNFTIDTFVEGKSNQLARAASLQIGENPGTAYNPLFIYGGVGLGKTHLLHAVGNMILTNQPSARVVYLHSEGFVAEMVKALQNNTIENFAIDL